jgi:hypothetical protein
MENTSKKIYIFGNYEIVKLEEEEIPVLSCFLPADNGADCVWTMDDVGYCGKNDISTWPGPGSC